MMHYLLQCVRPATLPPLCLGVKGGGARDRYDISGFQPNKRPHAAIAALVEQKYECMIMYPLFDSNGVLACRLVNLGPVASYIYNFLASAESPTDPLACEQQMWCFQDLMQDINAFCRTASMAIVSSPQAVIMQLRMWSPPTYWKTKQRIQHKGARTQSDARRAWYLVPPLLVWRKFFEEKIQVQPAKNWGRT